MQAPITSFYDWQQRFAIEQACLDAIAAQRWPEGFRCPDCGHDLGCALPLRPETSNRTPKNNRKIEVQ
jgi:hypothetical protein